MHGINCLLVSAWYSIYVHSRLGRIHLYRYLFKHETRSVAELLNITYMYVYMYILPHVCMYVHGLLLMCKSMPTKHKRL